MSTKFDLIIVFSEYLAKSAQDRLYNGKNPFFGKHEIYNDSYSYFLLRCKDAGIKAAFATSLMVAIKSLPNKP